MEKNWQDWIKENIERGCDRAEIVDILLRNHFSLPVIKKAMGAEFPDCGMTTDVDYDGLSKINIIKIAKRVDTELLQLYTLENFLSHQDCNDLIEIIQSNLRPSTLTADDSDKYFRTSSTCDMALLNNPLIQQIDQKISKALGINVCYSEGIQGQRYDIGQEFKPHTDYFEPRTEEYSKFAKEKGNRTWTFMIYLNNTIRGGETKFVKINKSFSPKIGMAVIWNNLYPDGTPNPNTLHWGLPVECGVKLIITKWFREKGNGTMFIDT